MTKRIVKKIIQYGGVDLRRHNVATKTYYSIYKKYRDFTMIPEDLFIANLDLCNKFLAIEGDIVECGVWRGGMVAGISELTGPNKKIHLFDSFEGLPKAKDIDGKAALDWQKNTTSMTYYDNCTADESFANEAMKKTGHNNYQLYKGWFQDTLLLFSGSSISILRLDGDWYDSTKICLDRLFPFVTEGGVVIIDDYHTWDGCAKAVHDYLAEIKSPSRICQWENQVAYIVKKN
ncbi:MAG TPA: TylF/MycF/NovP-related O-methyltransferase [Cyclobacteriaceae bacterium]|nr:TylF/MycF/NovP-related O-methyltransferase [Cyclobacteriaceae bacterium]